MEHCRALHFDFSKFVSAHLMRRRSRWTRIGLTTIEGGPRIFIWKCLMTLLTLAMYPRKRPVVVILNYGQGWPLALDLPQISIENS